MLLLLDYLILIKTQRVVYFCITTYLAKIFFEFFKEKIICNMQKINQKTVNFLHIIFCGKENGCNLFKIKVLKGKEII